MCAPISSYRRYKKKHTHTLTHKQTMRFKSEEIKKNDTKKVITREMHKYIFDIDVEEALS